ncbi:MULTISPECIES: prolyl oligopeptidase family serine peptidase [unclassified Imperialibacter]|uniref:S9 family peptidase n=1 Tax=unclassified Imperialibacter TaxID=2629706 RepID=UPI00125FD3D1|nr:MULTISPECIES: prolyl oligopeptidase family serine peptidase [unclassified Imperialibacter]
MMYRSFKICLCLVVAFVTSDLLAQKRVLTHDDVAGWNKIKTEDLSSDGKWAEYIFGPDEGDNTLVIKNLRTKTDFIIPRGSKPKFTFDAKHLIALVEPQLDSVRALKRLKKKKDELPKDSLAIFTLADGSLEKIAEVKSFKLPEKNGEWLAYLSAAKPDKKDSTSKKVKKISDDNGYTLHVLKLADGSHQTYPFVTSYEFSENGSRLAFQSTGDDKGFSPGIYTVSKNDLVMKPVFRSKGKYDGLRLANDGSRLAFLFDSDTLKKPFQTYGLFEWTPGQDSGRVIVQADDAFLMKDWQMAPQDLKFSDDNKRLFFGTQPKPLVGDTTLLDEEKAKVDVWHYKDDYLQPRQKVLSDEQLKRGYLAVYHFDSNKPVQLGNLQLQEVKITKEGVGNFALGGYESAEYRVVSQWEGSPINQDIYIININTGAAKLAKRKARVMENISPAGKFGYWYDVADSAWHSLEMASGTIRKLTDNSKVFFSDEENDSPNFPSPYGIAGWLENDSHILVYDRFDIWKIDPLNPATKERITRNGRETSITYRYVKTDPEETSIKANAEIVLKGFQNEKKQHGFFALKLKGSAPPSQLIMEDAQLQFEKKALNADTWLVTRETYREFPNLQLTNSKFSNVEQISDVNPQQQNFLWGTEELFNWVSLDGIPLEGMLFKPDNFDPKKKYPMMVYFYEQNADNFHNHITPEFGRSIINFTFYTSRGYVVFVPDIVYKIGYPGESAINCVMPGVTSLISQGFIDKDRIGVQGHSWGGYQIAYMVTKTQLFKAAEAGAPVPNMTSAYGGIRWQTGLSRMFQYEHTQSRIGGSLWEYPLRFLENSPLFWLDKVNTPLLIMHNDADGHVPWYQGIELFSALKRLGKPTWMISYNDQPHWPLRYPNRKDWTIRMQQYFDYYLMDAPAPLWMTEGVPAVEKGINYGLELSEDNK